MIKREPTSLSSRTAH